MATVYVVTAAITRESSAGKPEEGTFVRTVLGSGTPEHAYEVVKEEFGYSREAHADWELTGAFDTDSQDEDTYRASLPALSASVRS